MKIAGSDSLVQLGWIRYYVVLLVLALTNTVRLMRLVSSVQEDQGLCDGTWRGQVL